MPGSNVGIIERISRAKGLGDFHNLSDEIKFAVYKLSLTEMFTILGKDLLTLPKKNLDEIRDGLREIENDFYTMISKSAIRNLNLDAIQRLSKAASYLDSALGILGQGGKTPEFFDNLRTCRLKIFELMHHLP